METIVIILLIVPVLIMLRLIPLFIKEKGSSVLTNSFEEEEQKSTRKQNITDAPNGRRNKFLDFSGGEWGI